MDYDDDFDEEINESIDDDYGRNKTKTPPKKNQSSNNTSRQERSAALQTKGSTKDLDNKSRGGVRRTVVLSKVQPKKTNENEDYYMQPYKAKSNDDDEEYRHHDEIEDEAEEESVYKKPHPVKSESPRQRPKALPKPAGKASVSREVDIDSILMSRASEKKSIYSTPPRSHTSQTLQISYYDKYRDILESDTSTKTGRDLEIENNKIRDLLKDLNDQLSKIIERAKVANLMPRKVEFRHKNDEDKLRTTLKEIANNDKILDLTLTEYTTVKARLDQIKDPGYTLNIDEKIQDAKSKISSTNKTIKGLKLSAGNVGKDLDDIDKADGVAPMIQEANTKGKELAVLRKKLNKLKEQNTNFEEERETKNTKLETVTDQYKGLQVKAEAYKVFSEESKHAVRYQELKTQAKNLEEHIRIATNNNEKYLRSQLERNIEELFISREKDNEALERLEAMIDDQRAVLKEMLENEDYRTDRATMEVVNKIKISLDSNNRLTLDRPSLSVLSDQPRSKIAKPPLSTAKKPQNDIYSGLPLYSPPNANVKVDSLLKKKDIIKKEMAALKEQAREENQRSLTPEPRNQKIDFEGSPSKKKPAVPSKKNWKADLEESQGEPQQAQQERGRESSDKKKVEEDNDGPLSMPSAFAKPNLFKKSGANQETKAPSLSIPGTTTGSNSNKLELGPALTISKKDQPLIIPGQDAKKADEPLSLQKDSERGGLFLTNPGIEARNKKDEPLNVPGRPNEQKSAGLSLNEGLTLGGNFGSQKKPMNQELTLDGGININQSRRPLNQPANQELTLDGGYNPTKKPLNPPANQELTLDGGFSSAKKPLNQPANQELTLDGNFGKPSKPLGVVEEPKAIVKPKIDEEETFNIGGLSRLNRLKKGGGGGPAGPTTNTTANNVIPEARETLELTGFNKPTTNKPEAQLTLPGQELKLESGPKKTENQPVFGYQADSNKAKNNQLDDDLFGGVKPGGGLSLNKPNNPGANSGLTLNNDLFAKKDEPRGRDRSHLLAADTAAKDDDPFGSKMTIPATNVATNNVAANKVAAKPSTFDPDDIFAAKDTSNKKPEGAGLGFGTGAGSGNANTNAVESNNSGVGGIPGVRSGRGGVAARPKQVSAFDSDDMFGGSSNATKNTNTVAPAKDDSLSIGGGFGFGFGGNKPAGAGAGAGVGGGGGAAAGGGGLGFGGGFGFGEKPAANVGLSANTNTGLTSMDTDANTAIGAGPKRMRMNDLKQKGETTKDKEKNLASKAQGGGGFFDEIDL